MRYGGGAMVESRISLCWRARLELAQLSVELSSECCNKLSWQKKDLKKDFSVFNNCRLWLVARAKQLQLCCQDVPQDTLHITRAPTGLATV